ncbi:MAG: hypothetical protein H0X61_12890 [Acidimicrobiia bacterium]|nr:hypothetical protein [Acidimicrobiia bacterium]
MRTTVVALALVTATVCSFVAYALRPLADDILLNFAGIHESLAKGSVFEVLSGWNFRPVGYRLWLTVEHAIVSPFTATGSRRYQLALHVVGGFVLLGASAVAAWGWRRARTSASRRSAIAFGAIVFIALAWSSKSVPLQAEEFAVVLTLVAWGLASDTRTAPFAALPAAVLLFAKGSTFLLVFVVLARVTTIHGLGSPTTRRFMITTAAIDLAAVVLLLIVAPSELRDLLESGVYQDSSRAFDPQTAGRILGGVWRYASQYPALYAGAIATLFLLADQPRPRRVDLAVGWLVALALLVIGVNSYGYHFAVAMVPASLALGEVVIVPPRRLLAHRWGVAAVLAAGVVGTATVQELAHGRTFVVALAIVALIWVPILVLAAMVAGAPKWSPRLVVPSVLVAAAAVLAISDLEPWATSAKAYERERAAYRATVEGIEDRFLADQQQVLLLSYGTVAYHLDDVTSACRHYFPIPLQRLRFRDTSGTSGYRENLDCALSYTG